MLLGLNTNWPENQYGSNGYNGQYLVAFTNVPNLLYGFPELNTLHSNLNANVLFTWDINYDSPEKGLARLLDR